MKKQSIILLTSIVLLFLASCKKEEKSVSVPEPDNEFLTTVKLVAVNTADPTDTPTAKWVSIPGSQIDLSHTAIRLKKQATYNVQVMFLDESKSPATDITPEIKDRGNYHLICFNVASGLPLTVTATDYDTNTPALHIGLSDQFTTAGTGDGALEVVLHHQPNVKNGDCAPGSTDADVNFSVTVY